jgi:hypothetical protein
MPNIKLPYFSYGLEEDADKLLSALDRFGINANYVYMSSSGDNYGRSFFILYAGEIPSFAEMAKMVKAFDTEMDYELEDPAPIKSVVDLLREFSNEE